MLKKGIWKIDFLLGVFWLLGLIVLVYLADKIYVFDNNVYYISAFAILISAFLASLSMMKSINITINNENSKIHDEEKNLILHLEYILLILLDYLTRFEKTVNLHIKRMSENNKNTHIKDLKKDFFMNELISSKETFEDIRNKLENPRFYNFIESGNRMLLVRICILIYDIERSLNLLINSQNIEKEILETFNTTIEKNVKALKGYAKTQKSDLEKNQKFESLYTLEEFGDF